MRAKLFSPGVTIALTFLLFVASLSIGIINTYQASALVDLREQQRLSARASALAEALQRELTSPVDDLRALAHLPEIAHFINEQDSPERAIRVRQFLTAYLSSHDTYVGVTVCDHLGRPLIHMEKRFGIVNEREQRFLPQSEWINRALTLSDNDVLCSRVQRLGDGDDAQLIIDFASPLVGLGERRGLIVVTRECNSLFAMLTPADSDITAGMVSIPENHTLFASTPRGLSDDPAFSFSQALVPQGSDGDLGTALVLQVDHLPSAGGAFYRILAVAIGACGLIGLILLGQINRRLTRETQVRQQSQEEIQFRNQLDQELITIGQQLLQARSSEQTERITAVLRRCLDAVQGQRAFCYLKVPSRHAECSHAVSRAEPIGLPDLLTEDQFLSLTAGELPERSRIARDLLGSHKAIIIPLGQHDDRFGFLGVDGWRDDPLPAIDDFLRTTANLLGGVFEQQNYESELRRAMVLAEEAGEAKSRFLATMSHEIRTPLNGIMGLSQLLTDMGLEGEELEFVSSIHQSSEHLLFLVNQILDFSKTEHERIRIKERPFSLRKMLEESIDELYSLARTKQLTLVGIVDSRVVDRRTGDPDRLRQVLLNLIGNGIKYSRAGEIEVRIDGGDRERLHFSVRDTGIGIPEEDLQRIFVPFEQLDGSYSRQQGGTGLGLAISQGLIVAMGSKITVESRVGQGSRFRFTVTLPEDGSPMQAQRKGCRVAVQLEHPLEREALREALLYLGVSLSADETTADVLFSDRSGTQIIQRLRRDQCGVLVCHERPVNGHGTRLPYVTLPIHLRQLDRILNDLQPDAGYQRQATVQVAPPSRAAPVTTGNSTSKGHLLVAEDNMVNATLLTRLLDRAGYTYDLVKDGRDAVDHFREGRYALVLMDCQMPNMDGLTATRLIRDHEQDMQCQSTPIVAVTANAMDGDRQRCLDAGMNDYLPKPIKRDHLMRLLRQWLERDQSTDFYLQRR